MAESEDEKIMPPDVVPSDHSKNRTFAAAPVASRTARSPLGAQVTCTRCREIATPVEDTYPSWKTHVIASVLFVIGLPFCVFIPYCFDCFGKEVMRCPKCGCYINPTVGETT